MLCAYERARCCARHAAARMRALTRYGAQRHYATACCATPALSTMMLRAARRAARAALRHARCLCLPCRYAAAAADRFSFSDYTLSCFDMLPLMLFHDAFACLLLPTFFIFAAAPCRAPPYAAARHVIFAVFRYFRCHAADALSLPFVRRHATIRLRQPLLFSTRRCYYFDAAAVHYFATAYAARVTPLMLPLAAAFQPLSAKIRCRYAMSPRAQFRHASVCRRLSGRSRRRDARAGVKSGSACHVAERYVTRAR